MGFGVDSLAPVDPTLPADRRRSARRPGVTWGLGDFVWIYVAGLVVSVLLASVGYGISGDKAGNAGALTIGLAFVGQFGTWVVGLEFIARRKGRGSLRTDFGL